VDLKLFCKGCNSSYAIHLVDRFLASLVAQNPSAYLNKQHTTHANTNKHNMAAFNAFVKGYLKEHVPVSYYKLVEEEALRDLVLAKIPVAPTDETKICDMYTEEELKYMTKRKEEFCETLGYILHERLQPGFTKYSTIVNAGQYPFYIFDWWFRKYHTTVCRHHRIYIQGYQRWSKETAASFLLHVAKKERAQPWTFLQVLSSRPQEYEWQLSS
jgi:hypothetical protein